MRAHTITITKLALLLSVLALGALGALGLIACGGGDDEGTTTEATVPPDTTAEAKLPREQVQQVHEIRRAANDWASRFATNACNRYMGQPICERIACERVSTGPIRNCTPVSAAFQKSFADATIEDIQSKGHENVATVKFSNGEVVVFEEAPGPEPPEGSCAGPGSGCVWNLADSEQNRRFLRAATTPP